MSRKRRLLASEAFGVKRQRAPGPVRADPLRARAGSAREAIEELVQLFPRGLFEDALPPIALRSQVYSLVPDRTVADLQLKELQERGEIRIIQLGFDLDAHGIVFTEDYRTRVLKACDGRPCAGAVQKFLASVFPACGDLSFQQDQMTQTYGFRDPEITHLVNAGVLTVRDAGSWWLAVPGAGRFIKCFVKGRQAVLSMVRKAKYRELALSELLGRRAPSAVRLGLAYHVHDLIGAQLVDWTQGNSVLNSEFAHFGPRQLAPVLSFCYTVSPPLLEPSFACQIREEPTLGFCNSLREVPGSATPGWLNKSLQWVPGSAAASLGSHLSWAVGAAALVSVGVEPGAVPRG
ncbi:winged helix repair factor 1 isoform X1 [Arvicanthis niloticus]|uniref:winged helix repair factor 1 isoform X1 n=1 Tax=Arvicanthis niloticus TaxID=61156 RepID=UPI00402B8C3A